MSATTDYFALYTFFMQIYYDRLLLERWRESGRKSLSVSPDAGVEAAKATMPSIPKR